MRSVLSIEAQNFAMLSFQPSQPLPRIFRLSNTWVSVLPEAEEFLVMLYGFIIPAESP